MYLGQVLTLVNFGLLAAALVVYFVDPAIATFFLYGLIVWMFASLVLFYSPLARRRVGAGAQPSAPPSSVPPGAPTGAAPVGPAPGAPLASAATPAGIGFCIYCATPLPPGAGFCPSCGRQVRAF